MADGPRIRRILDEVWGRLWAGGVSDPVIAIEQISYFLLLKRIDLTQSRLLDGREPGGSTFQRTPWLRWQALRKMGDDELVGRLEDDLVLFLATSAGPAFERAMAGGRMVLNDPGLIRACIAAVDRLEFDAGDLDRQGEVFEALLGQLQLPGRHGQLRTPPALRRAMIELVDPRSGDLVCDPASGTGGLLVEAIQHMRREGPQPADAELLGFDVNEGMVRLGALNLLFHGIGEPAIAQGDTLKAGFEPPKSDVVITNPPFGETLERSKLDPALSTAGHRTELLFLERCRHLLRQGGSAAILVPQAVLFGKTADVVSVRQNWLERGTLHAVISLPADVLEPFTNVRTAIIYGSNWGETERVLFCQVPDQRRRRETEDGDAGGPLSAIAPAVKARLNGSEPASPEAADLAASMWSANIDQIKRSNWNLLPALYRPPEAIEQSRENPLDLLQLVEAGQAEIDQRLREARRLLEEA